ncbi:PHP domain-containing protein [Vallitalea longa]|uniref:PHP domain-containing protein n=1 Tax=Vallitalea longa TaxID=2936439 RepID=A0A9W5Y866_9FIRM|nr:PHP domain-containing protein [Vallitalea longa]GKX28557.1 PHP domain-containing protein [Vallitalea longa]
MDIVDLHTHTIFSDGDTSVDEILEVAKGLGYKIGISDHVFCSKMTTMKAIEEYLDRLTEYNVYKGIEANIGDYTKWSDRVLGKLDYVISSIHTYNDNIDERTWLSAYFGYRAGHRKDYVQQYDSSDNKYILEGILDTVKKTFQKTRVDILGHCTVLPFYEQLLEDNYIESWEEELLTLCEKYKVAIEISGLWKEPNQNFIKHALDKDILFSFGSDCHRKSEICNLKYPLQIIKKLNISEDKIFTI